MKTQPLVSIICVAYNHQNYVIETIKSALNQTYSPIEIIIIDDKSSDDTAKIIKNFIKDYPTIKFIENSKNLGNTKTFNKAVKYAHGEYLIDLACDDILLPKCVKYQIEAFSKYNNSEIGIVFGNSELINQDGDYIRDYFPTDENRNIIDKSLFTIDLKYLLKGGLCMNSVSSMMHRGIFNDLNGYDERLAFEDFDYWIRVLENYNIVYIDKILTQKRELEKSMSKHFFKKNKFANSLDKSMVLILQETINRHKTETNILRAILKRVHYGISNSIKSNKFSLLKSYISLKLRIHYFLIFSK